MEFDAVIRGGTVLDGSGSDPIEADVGIADGKIVAIERRLGGSEVIDAKGRFVAPGFIDIHTHYDAQVFWDQCLTPSSHHGVTSVIAGNCGFGIAPFRPQHRELLTGTLENVEDMDPRSLVEGVDWDYESFADYLRLIESKTTLLNFGAYIGHTAVRLHVMGEAAYERAAMPEEIDAMAAIVRQSMQDGAVGFSTSFGPTHLGVDGKPVPSRLASEDEFVTLASLVAESGGGAVGIVPGGEIDRERLYELQPQVGAPITYGALLTRPDGSHIGELERNERGWAEGADVWPQVTPRAIAFAISMAEPFTLNPNPMLAELMALDAGARLSAYHDAAWRDRAWSGFADLGRLTPRWETFEIGESRTRPDLVGRRVIELADEGATPFDVLCEIAVADGLETRVRAVVANDDEAGVAELLTADGCTLGLSDAGAHVSQLCDAAQATEYLGTWIRERNLLSWSTAIHRLTGRQADIFGIHDRGRLAPGLAADVVVFDPDTIAPGPVRRVRDFPADAERLTADQPEGIEHVLVNGVVVRRDAELVDPGEGRRPGRRLRPTAAV